jgi:hypothetical protein
MSYIQGEGRHQGTLFPVLLDDLFPGDHVCRVVDAFVNGLKMAALGSGVPPECGADVAAWQAVSRP